MTREKLAAELDAVRRESFIVSLCVWIVAGGVMIYGLGNVYGLLVDHKVPAEIAWLLSPMVDAGLCVGLVGTRGLTRYGVPAGWVGALRWITALMTLGLNIATPIVIGDLLGVFIHSVGPVLLFVIVEAAAAYQYKIGKVIGDKQNALDSADQKRDAEKAHRKNTDETLRARTAEVSAKAAEIETLTGRVADLTVSAERAEGEIGRLRQEITEAAEKARADKAEALRKQREKYETAMAEAQLPHLSDRRGERQRRGHRSDPGKGSPRATLTDGQAVQRLPDTKGGEPRQWSQKAIVDELSVGYGRAPRLLEQVTEAQRRIAVESGSGDQAVNE